jgi:hypothetical protein
MSHDTQGKQECLTKLASSLFSSNCVRYATSSARVNARSHAVYR